MAVFDSKRNRPNGFSEQKHSIMQQNYIWVITNDADKFIKACSNRETAKNEMEKWRNDFLRTVAYPAIVTPVGEHNFDHIYFCVNYGDGTIKTYHARKVAIY